MMLAVWCLSTIAAASPLSTVRAKPGQPAQVRLFPAGRDEASGRFRAVVEIALADGYKTYWREPGDSGVPTVFDWGASDNIADVNVRYPVPQRFFDGTGHAIGYLSTVRFPVEVTPVAAGKAVELRVNIDFGVCRDICIPEQATVAATLSDIEQIAGLWEDAVALTPVTLEPGGTSPVARASIVGSNLILTIDGTKGEGAELAGEGIFLEGPAGWSFGLPVRADHQNGALFSVPVRHPAFETPVDIDVTLAAGVAEDRAVETQVKVLPPQ